ncbi:hypothetical protein [Methylobacterium sp. A54F]
MDHAGIDRDATDGAQDLAGSGLNLDTRHLGLALRSIYEDGVDREPIPDVQVELLLRLRHKERDLRRAG